MNRSKILIILISFLLLIQFSIGLVDLHKKAALANDENANLVKVEISVNNLYQNPTISLHKTITLNYNEDEPIIEKLDFYDKASERELKYIPIRKKKIYLPLVKEEGFYSIKDDTYSVSRPSEGLFLIADSGRTIHKVAKGSIFFHSTIRNLGRFRIEGDKLESIKSYIKEYNQFNSTLRTKSRKKEISPEELEAQTKRAYLILAIDENGYFITRDVIIDGKSVNKDF